MSGSMNPIASPMQGTILFVAKDGQGYTKGSTIITLESMKMQHDIAADYDGVASNVLVEIGQTVKAGQLLLTFSPAIVERLANNESDIPLRRENSVDQPQALHDVIERHQQGRYHNQ
jgi:pyruvate/2-oxoglutarate dehydrogenase complex dihydrolipoamide acyltransferase (E2) component